MARRTKKNPEDDDNVLHVKPGTFMAMELLDDHGIDYDDLTADQHDRLEKTLAKVLEEEDAKDQEDSGKDSEKN